MKLSFASCYSSKQMVNLKKKTLSVSLRTISFKSQNQSVDMHYKTKKKNITSVLISNFCCDLSEARSFMPLRK